MADIVEQLRPLHEVDSTVYRLESERLKTFTNWPLSYIEPEKLAASGFYYVGERDVVRCFECGLRLFQWAEGDDPMEDHKSSSARCAFVNNLPCGNVPIGVNPSTIPQAERGFDDCGIRESRVQPDTANSALTSELQRLSVSELSSMGLERPKGPRHPDYTTYDARLKTFDTWLESMPQTKESLADAGFYYTGENDKTCCHHCGLDLKDWEAIDDPWVEHAKWFPECYFLLMVKGKEFVKRVTGQQEASTSTEQASNMDDTLMCKICYNDKLGVVFLPCGHMTACVRCAAELTTCAVCRAPVAMSIRVFLS